jgi:ABC-type nitrate/sulfonate/bicarbonate transport system substrate-binding protein
VAIVDFSAAVNGIRKGVPITIIAAPGARDPSGVIFTKDSGIRDWVDLKGQRVGYLPGTVSDLLARVVVRQKGLDPSQVNWQTIPPGAQTALLAAGTLKVVAGYAGAQELDLNCKGIGASSLRAFDSGVQSIGQVLVVNSEWAQKVGDDVVAKMLLGAIRGYSFVKTDPEEAVADMAKLTPNIQHDTLLELTRYDENHGFFPWALKPLDESRGFAALDASYVVKSIATLEDAGVLERSSGSSISSNLTTKYLDDPRVRATAQDWITRKWKPLPESIRRQCGFG